MRRQARPKRLTVAAHREGPRVRITLTDSGPGIPPAVLARIFEPFFTTKQVGEGTGLGLSLCRGIIEDHGGSIGAESRVGEGTCFTIDLPVAAPAAAAGAAAPAPAAPVVSPRAILVVDDEEDIATVLAEALARDGHKTEVATNGAMALGMLAQRAYDFVVSDTKMPIMDGEAFFDEAARRHPELEGRFVFLTGDVLSREKREFLERTGAPYLTKPCDLADVRRLIQRAAAERDGGT
jgi:CheY-like chemotaxis protein